MLKIVSLNIEAYISIHIFITKKVFLIYKIKNFTNAVYIAFFVIPNKVLVQRSTKNIEIKILNNLMVTIGV